MDIRYIGNHIHVVDENDDSNNREWKYKWY